MCAVRPDEVILAHLCYPCMCGCYAKITGWSILAWIEVGWRKELLRCHIHQLSYKVRACFAYHQCICPCGEAWQR
jgi:hypothetical protein